MSQSLTRIGSTCHLGLVTVVLGILAGCGGTATEVPLGTVTGTVTRNGQPVASVSVQFSPEGGGRSSQGVTDEQGKYQLSYDVYNTGAQVGKHSVAITPILMGPDDAEPRKPSKDEEQIIQKYGKGGLSAEVKAGANTIDFQVD